MKKQKGFTLIEIAIVLVITGTLLGGVLKGQELMTGAKVRNLAAQIDGVKVAYLGFQDRYHVLPGDMSTAAANASIPGASATPGCTGGTGCSNGRIDADEVFLVWQQLSRSGFIAGTYNGTIADTTPTAANNPENPYGGFLQLINDNIYDDVAEPAQTVVLNIKTGGLIPPGVVAELDRKFDDGAPLSGSFRSAGNAARTTALVGGISVAACDLAGPQAQWNGSSEIRNCSGVAMQ